MTTPAQIRKDRISRATPAWAKVDRIYAVYDLASEMRLHGKDVAVDHIYPLAGEFVCGLHVENNLRIACRHENSEKGNLAGETAEIRWVRPGQGRLF